MNMNNEIFDITLGNHNYTIEFDRSAIKTADNMNVSSNDIGELQRITIILYVGLMKHHDFITLKKVSKILDEALDEGYSLDSFAEIVDEFTANYKMLFSESAGTKKKPLVSRRNQVEKK